MLVSGIGVGTKTREASWSATPGEPGVLVVSVILSWFIILMLATIIFLGVLNIRSDSRPAPYRHELFERCKRARSTLSRPGRFVA